MVCDNAFIVNRKSKIKKVDGKTITKLIIKKIKIKSEIKKLSMSIRANRTIAITIK